MYSRLKEYIQERSRERVRLVLHITGTRNNIVVCLAAKGGYVFGTWSMGVAGLQGYKKTTYASGTLFAVHFGSRLAVHFGRLTRLRYRLEICFHGLRHVKHFMGMLLGLQTTQLPFTSLRLHRGLAFNGSRPRSRRRV
jgi:ribosomal protein S11